MKKILSLLSLIPLLSTCSNAQDDVFPQSLVTTKTDEHTRIEGSRVFVIVPPGFEHIRELVRYQKREDLYFQTMETSATSFTKAKEGLTEEVFKAKGAPAGERVESMVNGKEVIYIEGPSKKPGQTKLGLAFGTDSTYVMLIGVCSDSDPSGKGELLGMMRSMFYDAAYPLDPLELANFEFDKDVLRMRFSSSASNVFLYSPDGRVSFDETATSWVIQSMPAMNGTEAHSYAQGMLLRYRKKGFEFTTMDLGSDVLNGYQELSLGEHVEFKGKTGILYISLLRNEVSSVMMMGVAFDEPEQYWDRFKRTTATVRIKSDLPGR